MLGLYLLIAPANTGFSKGFTQLDKAPKISIYKRNMIENAQHLPISISLKLLEVYENRVPPPGATINHPVGHAVVRLRVENLTQKNISVNLIKIDIVAADKNNILISRVGKVLTLGGLQILQQGFHLTNTKGFINSNKVKAVVTYQVDSKTYIVESPLFEIN
jgi:hypothetical protein